MHEVNNDFDLIKKFVEGDESSFNRLAIKYQEKIYWHARRMTGNHLDADEIVQEVLIVLYNKLKTFEFKSSLYTWIFTITNTRSINYLKKKTKPEFWPKMCRNRGSNTGPLDLQSNALPTELSQLHEEHSWPSG